MCANHKPDPKLLPKLPLFSPEGEILTNGISSPHHVVLSSRERGEQLQVTLMELKEAKALSVEDSVVLSSVDPKHMCLGLVKEYQIELERIDQQLLELGPYAQDAYEEEPQAVQVLVSPLPPEVKRGKRAKNAAASHKTVRRPSRGLEEIPDTQKGGWRVVGGGFGEVSDRRSDDKELPKKKWRKVGSAGPAVRGKEGQLDAQSDPLNVSSANIINTPASDLEMRAIYQPLQGSKHKVTPGEEGQSHSFSPAQMASQQDRQLEVSGHRCPNELSAFSVSTTAHSTPSCNTISPLEAHGHSRTQPTAHWKPIPGGATHSPQQDIPHPLQEGYTRHKSNYAHLPQQVLMDTSGASEEVDVTKVEDEESPRFPMSSTAVVARPSEGQTLHSPGGYDTHPHHHVRRESHGSHHSEVFSGRSDMHQTPSPSPKTTIHGSRPMETNQHLVNAQLLSQHNLSAGNVPKQPGFSISHLTKGSDFSVQSPAHDSHSYLEPARGPLTSGMSGERSVVSPHGEVDGSMRKRRSSSSSSHRSTRQHPIDDNSLARAGSPLSARGQYVPGIIWDGGTAVHSPKDKPPTIGSSDKLSGMIPFSMWPPGMPVPNADGGTGQVQRYPLSSPFLTAPHHWLRGGMLPFRPTLYPAGAAALDPYKSMLGLPLYQFPPTGLKGAFATPAFSSPSSVPNSQPQTPSSISSTAGFPFGQYPLQPGMTPSAVQGRLNAGSAIQHPSLTAVGKDGKPRGSPEANQDTPQQPWPMLPGMPMMQAPFSFGVQNPLSSSMTQASQLNLLTQRGPLAFSTSPLTLATQSAAAGASSGDVQQSTAEAYHQTSVEGRRSKKQSGSTIDLTGRDQMVKHIQAPSPQEAVKMATQRLQDSPRFSPKLKNPPDSIVAPTSSSPLIATFVTNPNTLSTQAQGSVLSYPVLSAPGGVGSSAINMPPGHLINPSQLMGVALSGNHMIPMNYQPVTNVSGKAEDGGGKKRSPKRGGGSQKLRIHQMDFKSQGKIDRRRRQLKLPDKPQEESNASAGVKPGVSTQPTAVTSDPPSSASSLISEDNYALNMLADCSTKEGGITKQVTSASQQSQELASKRALMRSPGSIAGANSLLLLSKPDTISSASSTARSRASPPENAVVDGLLKLSNSTVSPPQDESNGSKDNENKNRSVLESGAQSNTSLTIDPSREGDSKMDLHSEEGGEAGEEKDKCDVDSEKTDTDSEATLTPTTPAGKWPQATLATQNETATRHREKTPSSTGPTPPPEFVKPIDVPFRRPLDSVPQDQQSPSDSIEAPSENHPTNQPSVSSTETQPAPPSPPNTTSSIPSPPLEGASSTVNSIPNESINETTAAAVEQEREEVSGIQPLPDAKEERELLDLGPPSSRLEMIDDEEDADVDVENIDSSVLDEPDPAISSPQSKSPVSTTHPPDVAPPQGDVCSTTSPSHPPLQPDPPSMTREPKEDKIAHEAQEEEMHPEEEEEPCLVPTSEREAELDVEIPSPKRPRVEESEKGVETTPEEAQVHEAMETVPQEDQRDEVMDAETSHSPVPATISPPTSSPQVTSPVLPISEVVPPTCTPPPESHPPPTTRSEQMAAELPKDDVEVHTTDVEGDNSQPCSKLGDDPITTKLPNEQDTSAVKMETDEAQRLKGTIAPETAVATEPVNPLVTSGTVAVEEKSPHTTNSNEGGDAIADSPSACTSGPTESDEQVPTEMKTSSLQKPTTPTSTNPVEMDTSNDCTSTNPQIHSRSSSPVANEKSSNFLQEDGSKQISSDLAQVEKSTTEDALQVPSETVSKVCPPVAQNRLPVGKSGFDRHQQHRKLMSQQHTHKQHSRDEKSLQSKKWSRGPLPDPASRTRGLFDVDPQESKRQKMENRGPEREPVRYSSEGRKVKPRVLPSAHGHSNKQSVDHSKYNSRPPRSSSEDSSHRHSRPPPDGPQGSMWDQRESSKQKVRPSGRQGQRFSPLHSHLTEHNSGHLKDRDVPLSLSDEEQTRSERARVGHQNSHGWRDGRHSPTDHTRDKGYISSKHKTGHRADSKQGFEHVRKVVRIDKDKDQRKHTIIAEANTDERATVFKRHREEDADHGSVRQKLGAMRKRSYESVSEDELPEESNQSSSRESSLVAEDRNGRSERRSSLETADQHGSVWRKEQKRAPEGSNTEEVSRISKHKKHKHSSKDWKERRKWRKPADSNDQKVKHSSEDKTWLSYHKH